MATMATHGVRSRALGVRSPERILLNVPVCRTGANPGERSPTLAMQKVVGSSPIIRSQESPAQVGFFRGPAFACPLSMILRVSLLVSFRYHGGVIRARRTLKSNMRVRRIWPAGSMRSGSVRPGSRPGSLRRTSRNSSSPTAISSRGGRTARRHGFAELAAYDELFAVLVTIG